MIYIDDREETKTQKLLNSDLLKHFPTFGAQAEACRLPFGDAMMEVHGPEGPLLLGVERKKVHDYLDCIETGRLSGHQLIGMKETYDIRVLMLEGHWKPHDPQGILMEGFSGGMSWGYARPRGQRVMYAKLKRHLISLSLAGVIVDYSRDPFHTAYNINEYAEWGKKKWDDHTSLQEMHKIAIPTLNHKPSLLRRWAADLDGVGMKMSALAERRFRSALDMAQADESEWLRIPGVGVKTAQSIVREIWKRR